MLFDIEQELLRVKVNRERLMTLSFAMMGIGCPLVSLVYKSYLDPSAIGCTLAFGLINSGCLIAAIEALKQPEKYLETFQNANKELIKKSLAYDINYALMLGQVNAQRKVAHEIEKLPAWEHKRWIGMFGLSGILKPPVQQTAVLEPSSEIEEYEYSGGDDLEDIDELVQDFDYLEIDDPNFVIESKAVFGNKGSGKSSFMGYEALQFVSQFPNGRLFIGDIHYADEDSKWLPFIDDATFNDKYLADTPTKILKVVKSLDQLLRDRKAAKLTIKKPECFPVKFIWDEVLGTLDELEEINEDFPKYVIKVAERIQLQGDKYGIQWTLGLHSIKKTKSGFDSSFFNNLSIVCLGTSIADNTVKYPSDFDVPKLLEELDATNQMLPIDRGNDGRTKYYPKGIGCVIRRKDTKPVIKVIPPISLPTRGEYQESKQKDSNSQDVQSVNAFAMMQTWLDGFDDVPTDQQIRSKWWEITENELDDKGLKLLKETLGII